jgi:acetyltransferase
MVREITLRNGTKVIFRSPRSGDEERLLAMHSRLSADSVYNRYLSARTPSRDELAELVQMPETVGGVLIAATTGVEERIVGVAYYVRDGLRRAEPAILIEDQFQRQGLGRELMRALIEHALRRGIDTFSALIYGPNRAVMGLIRSSGLPFKTRLGHGAREVIVDLQPVRELAPAVGVAA